MSRIRRIYGWAIWIGMLVAGPPAWARSYSVVELSAGAGWSTFHYEASAPTDGLHNRQTGSWAMRIHAGYTLLFCEYIGVGVVADVTRYGAETSFKGVNQWQGIDTDGEPYTHRMTVRRWIDRQDRWYIQPGVVLLARVPIQENWAITASVGGRYNLPIAHRADYEGTINHIGIYPQWGLTLYDMPNHGYYTGHSHGKGTAIQPPRFFDITAQLGAEWMITKQLALIAQLWGAYGLDKPSRPIAVGLEIGARWRFPHTAQRKHPCRCLELTGK